MHCSRVFRSSVPSDLLPSSPCGRPSGTARGGCGSTRSMEWGVGPGGGVPHRGCCPAGKSPRQAHPGRHVAGAGPLSGEGRTTRDPELVARAQRAATRPESAWEPWRALHGLAVAPGQPVVSYVGYSLKEPWGEPRVVRVRRFWARASTLRPRPRSADQARDLAGWTSGELSGQVSEQLTSWPPSADQPPASV